MKKIRNILMAFVLVVCSLFFVACGDKTPMEEKAFTALKNAYSNSKKAEKKSTSQQVAIIKMGMGSKIKDGFEPEGLNQTQKETLFNNVKSDENFFGYAIDGEKVKVNYNKEANSFTGVDYSYDIDNDEWVYNSSSAFAKEQVDSQTKYYAYFKELNDDFDSDQPESETNPKYVYSKKLADVDYPKYAVDLSDAIYFLEDFVRYDSFNDLKKSAEGELDYLTKGFTSSQIDLDEIAHNVVCSMTKENDVYTFKMELSFSNIALEVLSMNYIFDCDTKIELTFNENNFISSLFDIHFVTTSNQPVNTYKYDDDNLYNGEIPIQGIFDYYMSCDFVNDYEEENFTQEEITKFKGLTCTQGVSSEITMVVNGHELSNCSGYCGDNINIPSITGLNITKWYVDEACTVEFEKTKFPSYDFPIYAQIQESDIQDGYVVLYVRYPHDIDSDMRVCLQSNGFDVEFEGFDEVKINGVSVPEELYVFQGNVKVYEIEYIMND